MTVPLDTPRGGAPERVVPPRDLGLDPSWFASPDPLDFPTGDGEVAHALVYWPRNPTVDAPEDQRPPLLVMIHGGPTAAAQGTLRLAVQYWTSRGIAVVDVNYRGSTGYGRAYRDLLQGQWGVADVEDCAAVARFLVERGDVDPDPALHPWRIGRRVHGPRRARRRGRVLGGHELLRRRRPGRPGDGHPQVREPLPGRAGRPVASGPRRLRGALADQPHGGHRPPAVRVPGPRGRGRAAQPVADDRRRRARRAACRSPT